MRSYPRLSVSLVSALAVLGTAAPFARAGDAGVETVQLPGAVADTASATPSPRSATSIKEPGNVEVYRNPWQLSLSPGVVSFRGANDQGESRLSVSAFFVRNFAPTGAAPSPIQYGVETGLLYSHLGAPGASFFGTGGGYAQNADGNLFAIPLHVWGGYYFEESRVLLGAHTGADLLLRTDDSTIDLGGSGAAHFYPSFGFKAGVDTRNNYAVTFEANWSLAPNAAVFSGVIGATIPLS